MDSAGRTDFEDWEGDLIEWTTGGPNGGSRRSSLVSLIGQTEAESHQTGTSALLPVMYTNPFHYVSQGAFPPPGHSQARSSTELTTASDLEHLAMYNSVARVSEHDTSGNSSAAPPPGWEQACLFQPVDMLTQWPRSVENSQPNAFHGTASTSSSFLQPDSHLHEGTCPEVNALQYMLHRAEAAREQMQFEQWLQSRRMAEANAVVNEPVALMANQGLLQPRSNVNALQCMLHQAEEAREQAQFEQWLQTRSESESNAAACDPSIRMGHQGQLHPLSGAATSHEASGIMHGYTVPSALASHVVHGKSASNPQPQSTLAALIAQGVAKSLSPARMTALDAQPKSSTRTASRSSSPRKNRKTTPSETESLCEVLYPLPNHALSKPLTAYNYFYRDERLNIMNAITTELDPFPNPVSDFSRQKLEILLHQHWHVDPIKKKRSHRKGHGKLGFEDLSKTIAVRWHNLSPEGKAFYRQVAKIDDAQYKRSLRQNTNPAAVATTVPASTLHH